jgi:K+-sensing histidine kinase KdpD
MADSQKWDNPDKFTEVQVLLVGFGRLVLVGFVDYITGYELHFDVFYSMPVSICAWHLQRRYVVVTAILGALTWGYADKHAGHQYSSQVYWYWNILVRFSSLLLFGLVVQSLRYNFKKQARAKRELEQTLADLRKSAAEIEKLQNQLQVVCAWTQRIKIEGRWLTFDQFLQEHLHLKLSHGISPEAMSKLLKENEEKNDPQQT